MRSPVESLYVNQRFTLKVHTSITHEATNFIHMHSQIPRSAALIRRLSLSFYTDLLATQCRRRRRIERSCFPYGLPDCLTDQETSS